MSYIPIGDVRSCQLLWTYGPGALIDLLNLPVLTMGLERWDEQAMPGNRGSAPARRGEAGNGQPGDASADAADQG